MEVCTQIPVDELNQQIEQTRDESQGRSEVEEFSNIFHDFQENQGYLFDSLHLGCYLKLIEFILVSIDTNAELTTRSERKEAAKNTLSAYQAVLVILICFAS